jgi:hypothetical protein
MACKRTKRLLAASTFNKRCIAIRQLWDAHAPVRSHQLYAMSSSQVLIPGQPLPGVQKFFQATETSLMATETSAEPGTSRVCEGAGRALILRQGARLYMPWKASRGQPCKGRY